MLVLGLDRRQIRRSWRGTSPFLSAFLLAAQWTGKNLDVRQGLKKQAGTSGIRRPTPSSGNAAMLQCCNAAKAYRSSVLSAKRNVSACDDKCRCPPHRFAGAAPVFLPVTTGYCAVLPRLRRLAGHQLVRRLPAYRLRCHPGADRSCCADRSTSRSGLPFHRLHRREDRRCRRRQVTSTEKGESVSWSGIRAAQ